MDPGSSLTAWIRTLWSAVRRQAEQSGAKILLTTDRQELHGADAVYSDIWASMGEEDKIPARTQLLTPYRVDEQLLADTAQSRRDLYALPALVPRLPRPSHGAGAGWSRAWISGRSATSVFRSSNIRGV